MDNKDHNNNYGLGLKLPSSQPASQTNIYHHQPKQTRKVGRKQSRAKVALGLTHTDKPGTELNSHTRLRDSTVSPITQRKKSQRKARARRNYEMPRIQVDTNIYVHQAGMPVQLFPVQTNDGLIRSKSYRQYLKASPETISDSPQPNNGDFGRRVEPYEEQDLYRQGSSAMRNHIAPELTDKSRGKVSRWLKGTEVQEEESSTIHAPSRLSSLRLAGISPSDGPIPIGIDQETLTSLNSESERTRIDNAAATPTVMITPAKEFVSRWSLSSPESAGASAALGRSSSIYSSMNGICNLVTTDASAPPVPAIPKSAFDKNLARRGPRMDYFSSANEVKNASSFIPSSPRRTLTNESENTIIEEDESPLESQNKRAAGVTNPLGIANRPMHSDTHKRADLTIDTAIPTPRRSRGWWNVITTPFDFLGSSGKLSSPTFRNRGSIRPMPFGSSALQATPETKDPETLTETTFPSPSEPVSTIIEDHPSPDDEKDGYKMTNLAPVKPLPQPTPIKSQASPYQKSLSGSSHTAATTASSTTRTHRERTTTENVYQEQRQSFGQKLFKLPIPSRTRQTSVSDTPMQPIIHNHYYASRDHHSAASERDWNTSIKAPPSRASSKEREPVPNKPDSKKRYTIHLPKNPKAYIPHSRPRQAPVPVDDASRSLPTFQPPPTKPVRSGRSCIPSLPFRLPLHGKQGKCIAIAIAIGITVIILAIVVPAMTVNRDPDDSGSSSVLLDVANFPAVPSGITTVAATNAVVQNSGCVAPSTLWSCALPKELQDSQGGNAPTEPAFRIEIGEVDGAGSAPEPFPPPPTADDQIFLGNTTDGIEEPFEGEETPFFISLLPLGGDVKRKVKRQLGADPDDDDDDGDDDDDDDEDDDDDDDESEEDDDDDDESEEDDDDDNDNDDIPDLTSLIPSPSTDADGLAAPANLLAFPKRQRLRLYNRGLDDEHYGFYIYYDRSIFLQSVTSLNQSDSSLEEAAEDLNGGARRENASKRCTWAQTRLRVQIWTGGEGIALLGQDGEGESASEGGDEEDDDGDGDEEEEEAKRSVEELLKDGIFPYPLTVTLDRHGGNEEDKMIYCYGLEDEGKVVPSDRTLNLEDRGFGGRLVSPSDGPFGNATVAIEDGGPGGIDGGTGGCSCQFVNFVDG